MPQEIEVYADQDGNWEYQTDVGYVLPSEVVTTIDGYDHLGVYYDHLSFTIPPSPDLS